ncbi:plastoquinol--plastocyanin reductase [Candidatus Methylomirabilis limnetica]|jgi:Rieske Fe-S protein|uniref:Plastoquinol--plastocyanin reductase n=1 Tax=Candidatus Methylomirabilis limnetica TaxID=2033718 RepID=A0A2T4U154_9BACT|nr:Rieske 2Fe-2S domain-containing protein [Candidatus Methylomirabilis limnetica]PTL37096.1 plastoquinol--plastocyanin reductase [Candidatus Methylomirabilis limnetica]
MVVPQQDEQVDYGRRTVNWLLGSSIGVLFVSILYPVVKYLIPPKLAEPTTFSVTLPWKLAELKANSGRIFRFRSRPGLLVKTSAGELKAFSAVCSHLECTVQYREERQDIWCACHNGVFDLNGKNISGPPPRPLESLKLNVRGDQIVVMKG